MSLPDANVEVIPNGTSGCMTSPECIRLTGAAIITANGSVAGYSGSEVRVELTGGNLIRYSNIKLTFNGTEAVAHFGPQPYEGLVVIGR